jgi:two-component system, LytTR family, response regulator
MLNAVIVDDECSNRQVLANLIHTNCPLVNILGQADSVETAFQQITDKKPQLVFLDIQMPTGNGFQLLEKFEPVFFDTIFVTSYDQYAINAIKFSALDYLLKPIDIQELKMAVTKAMHKNEKENNFQLLYHNLLNNIKPELKGKTMTIHQHSNVILVQMSKVIYIEADSNYSFIYMQDGTHYHTAKTMKEIEEFVNDIPVFVRVNRSVIINTTYCSHYQKGDPYTVMLANGKQFEISRRKRPEVLEKLKFQLIG